MTNITSYGDNNPDLSQEIVRTSPKTYNHMLTQYEAAMLPYVYISVMYLYIYAYISCTMYLCNLPISKSTLPGLCDDWPKM